MNFATPTIPRVQPIRSLNIQSESTVVAITKTLRSLVMVRVCSNPQKKTEKLSNKCRHMSRIIKNRTLKTQRNPQLRRPENSRKLLDPSTQFSKLETQKVRVAFFQPPSFLEILGDKTGSKSNLISPQHPANDGNHRKHWLFSRRGW